MYRFWPPTTCLVYRVVPSPWESAGEEDSNVEFLKSNLSAASGAIQLIGNPQRPASPSSAPLLERLTNLVTDFTAVLYASIHNGLAARRKAPATDHLAGQTRAPWKV